MARIGFYSARFDPPDRSVADYLKEARKQYALDRLIVSVEPKSTVQGFSAPSEERLKLCRRLFKDTDGIEFTLRELSETLASVRKKDECFVLRTSRQGSKERYDNASLILYDSADRADAAENRPAPPLSDRDVSRLTALGYREILPPELTGMPSFRAYFTGGPDLRMLSNQQLERIALSLLKEKRVAHVKGCRDTAVRYAKLFGDDPVLCERAALLHDVTKAFSDTAQLILFRKHGIFLSDDDLASPQVWHELSGAAVAEHAFGESPAAVQAIRRHTTGDECMTKTDLIIYLADLLEPGRSFDGVDFLRGETEKSLEKGFYYALKHTVTYLQSQNTMVHQNTMKAFRWISNTITE